MSGKARTETLEDFLKRTRSEPCPLHGTKIPYSLTRGTFWCPDCKRIWWYRYLNHESPVKKALRLWGFKNDKNSVRKI